MQAGLALVVLLLLSTNVDWTIKMLYPRKAYDENMAEDC